MAKEAVKVEEEIEKYSNFLSERLAPDMKVLSEKIPRLQQDQIEYEQLKKQAVIDQTLGENSKKPYKTMVQLDGGVLCEAVVKDTSQVFVDIGFQLHLAMNKKETAHYCTKKITLLKLQQSRLEPELAALRARYKVVNETLLNLIKVTNEINRKKVEKLTTTS